MVCPYCGNEHPAGAGFCPVTGKSLSPIRVCRHCGQTHARGAEFCPVTGKKIEADNELRTADPARKMPRLFTLGLPAVLLLILAGGFSWAYTARQNEVDPTGEKQDPSSLSAASPAAPSIHPSEAPQSLVKLTETHVQPTLLAPTKTLISLPSPVAIEVNPADGAVMVLVPAGEFTMGSNQADDPFFWGAEAPAHPVILDAFWIYQTEVTQAMYQKCDEENACPAPEKINDPVAQQYGNTRFSDYPVVMVTWQAALAYCQWAGGRLPTEAEWEKAARGVDGRLFPWGNDPEANGRARYASSSPAAVASYPEGLSPYGVYDMAGNVLEWVNDTFQSGYYQISPLENPPGPASGNRRVIRGGAFNHPTVDGLRTVARASLKTMDTKVSVGFRCVVDDPQ